MKVVAGAGRQHSAWRGGSVFASLPSFSNMCVSRQELQEHGTTIVREKLLWGGGGGERSSCCRTVFFRKKLLLGGIVFVRKVLLPFGG